MTAPYSPELNDIPTWVAWLAQDADGTWWGYECQPLEQDTGWYENECGRCVRLGGDVPNPAWRETLMPRSPDSGQDR